ncbi:hypothetical protein FB45DRAFT_1025449 [Roridomyces roridus]|uniref:Uncharacterized protein n=1 Tax=Roridomyces roridus TaxID=1738132 RepID=A0AAD7BYP0_9AGAR|nr:hypothetical protein FB45DRAFT_1025449 [Roridomyces roridus]
MTTPTTRTFDLENVQTYGWPHAQRRLSELTTAEAYFNPANPGASATGGLGEVFVGHGEKQLAGVEDVRVVLSSVPGQLPAFARNAV